MICPGKRYSHSVHMEEAEQHKVWIISANYVPIAVYGSQTANSRNEVKKWLSEAGFSVELNYARLIVLILK